MRVIAGSARGVVLGPVPPGTRPLSDRAREGLFSSLGPRVEGARIADLFAGTGAVGIEALSRGAAACLFVDRSAAAVRAVRDNLRRAGVEDRGRVVRAEVPVALRRERGRFDLAFLDPPYRHPVEDLRRILVRVTTLAPGGTMVLTRPRRDATDVIPVDWSAVKVLTYGDARIFICREDRYP
jgi:16S rRNA (guanine966-N2)-methyltransferase